METYVCLLLDAEGVIVGSATLTQPENNARAHAEACALLRKTERARGFELWSRGDRVDTYFPKSTRN
jgi:hypothetical protein